MALPVHVSIARTNQREEITVEQALEMYRELIEEGDSSYVFSIVAEHFDMSVEDMIRFTEAIVNSLYADRQCAFGDADHA